MLVLARVGLIQIVTKDTMELCVQRAPTATTYDSTPACNVQV